MLWITLVLFIVGGAVAEVKIFGRCPQIESSNNFDVTSFLGEWYEFARFNNLFEKATKCVTLDFTLAKNSSVLITYTHISSKTNKETITEGIAEPIGKSRNGKFAVTYPSLGVFNSLHWVLGTNYDEWAVLWSCQDCGISSIRYAWILTKKRKPSASVLEEVYSMLDGIELSKSKFDETNQKNCQETY